MTVDRETLIAAARDAQTRAYAPYSRFTVGAAVAAGGRIFTGANVENAAYPMCTCAERSAVAAAISSGARTIDAVAVSTAASPPASPCGQCRQILAEFAPDPAAVTVVSVNDRGEQRTWTVAELLPDGFTGRQLP